MKMIKLFCLTVMVVIFSTDVYASLEDIHITYIDDDRSLIEKINTRITPSARKFFHQNPYYFKNEEPKVYNNDYKKFYFIYDNKDILFSLCFTKDTQDNLLNRIPTKVLFNLKKYKDFTHSYEVYLKALTSEQNTHDICGKYYYNESMERITNQFHKFNQCLLAIVNKRRVYLSEFSSLINSLSIMDSNIARIQQEIGSLEKSFDEVKQCEKYTRVNVIVNNFITSVDTLTN